MLRVISGKYRHRLLQRPNEQITRPTKDSVREAIFNALRFDIENSIVLDIFAGSGSLGIEALSNGAMKCIFVESKKKVFNILNQNLNSLNIKNADVYCTDALNFLNSKQGIKFKYIFVDPPYREVELLNQVLELIFSYKFLESNGLVVVEIDDVNKIKLPKKSCIQKLKKYGLTSIVYISHNN
ncbi:16S rRNA (guanine(966)-N(2))-methyltransferase RsmD [Mycoplasmopsis mucosicanis]|uniref:16S rRNA (Guanine(966)-N(2))-methyltransferase RsmD n=1 Tax=Mycoplasmopsis mucosicanis TaxID=458208 RepID=A0A507SQC9_9BACT|nr:16S rRNA (guanine(966)-N(2))-methyltransferase RsmD [Mycoplasmopsis mucosicanis]TQC54007.1 16S rRNA (guanine(966)-N(2))-methyltransferase RsmD [Mycoplasmopsis mucosicanis]